jgi:hypothetical protein
MNGISRSFGALGALAFAAALMGAPAMASASHSPYPPGWNTPTQPSGQVLYQFTVGGERYHVVPQATSSAGATK